MPHPIHQIIKTIPQPINNIIKTMNICRHGGGWASSLLLREKNTSNGSIIRRGTHHCKGQSGESSFSLSFPIPSPSRFTN